MSAIVIKDIKTELRTRKFFSAMLTLALLLIIMFNFSLELEPGLRSVITPGILWATFIFAGTVGINRTMAIEMENGCLDSLRLNPTDRSAVYFGKFFCNLIFLFIVEVIVIIVYSFLYNVNLAHPGLLLVVVLGSIGYVAVATLLSAIAVQTHMREVLLPILLLPVVLPIVLAAVKTSNGFLQGLTYNSLLSWINLLIVYDVIFMVLAFLSFEYVIED